MERLHSRAERLSAPARYLWALPVAALGVAGSAGLHEAGAPALFAVPLLGVALCVWLLGPGPALLAGAVATLVIPWAVFEPRPGWSDVDGGDLLAAGVFGLTAVALVGLGHALRAARARAERAMRRSDFLAEASLALDAPATVEERLERLAWLAVPRIADWCAIDLAAPDGGLRLAAVAHADPEKVAAARRLRERYPPDPDAPSGVARVLREGQPELLPEVTDEMLVAAARDEEHLAAIRGLGFASAALVPLRGRGRTLGVLTLVTAESGRRLGDEDLATASELARRAALAAEMALLYEARVEASERVARLGALTAALAGALTPEEVAEAVVREGRLALGADAAAVALVRDGRLYPLATEGYEPETVSRWHGVPLGVATPAADAIRSGATVAVPTAAERAERYPMLSSAGPEGRQSLVAAPLVIGGAPVGFIGLSFREARVLSQDEMAQVEAIGGVAAQALQRARLYEAEHRVSQTLQRSLLPDRVPSMPGLDVAARFLPAGEGNEVGGDFWDAFAVEDDLVVVIGDVCGKGVVAATMTALARHTVRAVAEPGRSPCDILRRLNDSLLRHGAGDKRFITAAVAVLRQEEGGVEASVCCAGHPPAQVVSPDGAVRALGVPGSLLGVFESIRLRDVRDVLAPGESLVLYTDGVTEARSGDELFGEGRLRAALAERAGAGAGAMAAEIERRVRAFEPGGLRDDMAAVVVRVAQGSPDQRRARLAADTSAPGQARRLVDQLADSLTRGQLEVARLLVSEVVTNSLLHAGGEAIEVDVRLEDGALRVEVVDEGPGLPDGLETEMPPPHAAGGRGIALLAGLAGAWGHAREPAPAVWFTVGPDASLAGRRVR